ncbi:MAG: excinuclease ABC subunit UvrC [Planctomycetes bacterium]|nr:excinuclease ABC subunit UvrC [Planctomycetota bacterium]
MSPANPSETLDDIPALPGCYIFRDEQDAPLYVGKARELRSRVRSYFRAAGDGRVLIPFLARKAARIETIITKTESEAILLEDTLIKRFKPPYNLRLKDDKAFYLLRLDPQAEFPRFEWVRRRHADRALYFGPYASAGALRRTIRFLHSIIPMRDCSDNILNNRSRPCLKYSIGRCSAPCVGLITKNDYQQLVARARDLLEGRTTEVEKLLEERMAAAAARLEFEKAARCRDQLDALRTTTEAQGVRLGRSIDRDIIGLCREGERVAIQWLPFRGGKLEGGKSHLFQTDLPESEVFNSFLTQLYRGDVFIPREIYLSHEPHDRETIAAWLGERRGGTVNLTVAKSGDAKRAVEMAVENAQILLAAREGTAASAQDALVKIQDMLNLDDAPAIIDCFDISTLQGRSTVASRVRFVDGLPAKDGYRRFKITSFSGQNDFAAMREVVARALRHDVEDQTLPDLIVIDGGLGQLNAALEAREESGAFEVSMVSLAKDRIVATDESSAHSGERVFVPGRAEPIPLQPRTAECHLFARIRDEAHRFAITYHRKQRGAITSDLDRIEGVGQKRRRDLLRTFGSMAALRGASAGDIITKIPGFPRELAERVAAAMIKITEKAP